VSESTHRDRNPVWRSVLVSVSLGLGSAVLYEAGLWELAFVGVPVAAIYAAVGVRMARVAGSGGIRTRARSGGREACDGLRLFE
jgi:hypothetical protein